MYVDESEATYIENLPYQRLLSPYYECSDRQEAQIQSLSSLVPKAVRWNEGHKYLPAKQLCAQSEGAASKRNQST